MGISGPSSHIKKEDLDAIQGKTQFDSKELRTIYKQFKKETPSGVISKSELREFMKQMNITDPFIQDVVFRIFDINKDGFISFAEFVQILSVLTRGNPEQKLELAFRMFDTDESGKLTKEKLMQFAESFSKLVGPLVTYSGRKYDSSEQFVAEFFEQTDTNEDGIITLDEYKEGAMKNPDVISGLRLYDSK